MAVSEGLKILLLMTLAAVPGTVRGEDLPPIPELANSIRGVVVLNDGHVFSGTISNVAGGYRVDSNGTYAIVPFTKVDVIAESLNAAYETMRDRVLRPTVTDHLQLAEWCLRNELVGQARSETTMALKLEPLRPEARQLMLKIDSHLNPQPEPAVKVGPAMTLEGFLRADEKTAAGLSREVHQDYIRQIQPLLLNKCGNAYCHGEASKNGFRLTAIRRGVSGNRLQSQDNLDAVLAQVNNSQPDASPLLQQPVDGSNSHRRVFSTPQSQSQFEIIRKWVLRVAQDRSPSGVVPHIAGQEDSHASPIQLVSGQSPGERAAVDFDERAMLDQVRQQSKPDPFDPEIFNRRVHGATSNELRERSLTSPTDGTRELPLSEAPVIGQ